MLPSAMLFHCFQGKQLERRFQSSLIRLSPERHFNKAAPKFSVFKMLQALCSPDERSSRKRKDSHFTVSESAQTKLHNARNTRVQETQGLNTENGRLKTACQRSSRNGLAVPDFNVFQSSYWSTFLHLFFLSQLGDKKRKKKKKSQVLINQPNLSLA